jgi:signal transduction histidine kinase
MWAPVAGLLGMAVVGVLARIARQEHHRAHERQTAALRGAEAEATARLQAMVEVSPLAMVLHDDDGQISFANEAARTLFFSGQRPEGKNFLRLLKGAPEALKRALTADDDDLFTLERDGQRETFGLSRRAVTFDGRPHQLLAVKLATREVSRREVEILKKVIRVISHELNNSLGSVSSLLHSAKMIARDPQPRLLPRLATALDTIQERTEHLKGFLDGYAALARVPRPMRRSVAIVDLAERLRRLYPDVAIEAAACEGHFDAAQIEQVVINLMKNAREAGGADIDTTLAISASEEPGAIEIRLADRGKGLSDEALAHVTMPFFTTKPKGSGLGLTLCRDILEAHGGSLLVRNREGGGAEVMCYLPGPTPASLLMTLSRASWTLGGHSQRD